MRTVYLYFNRVSDRQAWFSLEPNSNYDYVKKELDIDFSNFDKYIYEIFWDDNSLFFADKNESDIFYKKIVNLESLINDSILNKEVIQKYKKLLKVELKKYRGDYRIYFAKIKKKYKKYKNKLISEYFNAEISNPNNKKLIDYINQEFNGKSPIDIEKYFKQFVCSKTKYIKKESCYTGFYFYDEKIYESSPSCYPIKYKKYILVDEFC